MGVTRGEMPKLGEEAMDDGGIREASRQVCGVGVRGGECPGHSLGFWFRNGVEGRCTNPGLSKKPMHFQTSSLRAV